MGHYFFDSHAHLTCDALFSDVEGILSRAETAGVRRVVNICTDKVTLERGIGLREKYPWVYNSGSTTPHDVEKEGELYFPLFEKSAREGALLAIGETGLDYFYEHSDREKQKAFLVRYLRLAKELQLPVIFHCRDAFDDLFAIADREFSGKALLHCFTGTVRDAREALSRGWYISLSGILTFKKSLDLRKTIEPLPLEQLLIETDAPYLAPQSKRGKQNEPSFVRETAEMLAEIKNLSLEEVAQTTYQNASTFFSLS